MYTYNRQVLKLQGLYMQKAEALSAVERYRAQINEVGGRIQSSQRPDTAVLANLLDSLYRWEGKGAAPLSLDAGGESSG